MDIIFRNRKLEKCYASHQAAVKAYGDVVARNYILRINSIKQAQDIEELKSLPMMNCHPLKGNHKGRWAMNLTGYMRLIFSIQGNALEIACIEDVSKHYED